MPEYIDREALMRKIHVEPEADGNQRAAQILECILSAPLVDVEPARHGRWEKISITISENLFRCSGCKHLAVIPPDVEHEFCPTCRAKMDGGDNNG